MKKLILLLFAVLGHFAANADNWIPIGGGYYEDPIWDFGASGTPYGGNVMVQEDLENSGSYRFRNYLLDNNENEYIYVHCENPNKVYVSDYLGDSSDGYTYVVSLRCPENGWSGYENYGKLADNEVVIPASWFSSKATTSSTWQAGDTNRNFILRLPVGADETLPSGIYFGITAFNHLPKFMPIQMIDGSNKHSFQEFVNSQELDEYTYLYYSVDKAIDALQSRAYPKDLNSVAIITFTDGNDDGSLEVAPNTSWTDIDYQQYVGSRIKNTAVLGHKLEAFSIGLKGEDIGDYNYDLFKSNLLALASDEDKASEVSDMNEVERTLNDIIDRLEKSWLNKKVSIKINMRGTGDVIRFTLDKTREQMNNNPENSELWIEGVFSRDDISLNDIVYHGFTSTSGTKVVAEPVTIDGKTKYQFTFENLLDADGNNLETGEINFWHKNSSTPAWQPHTESGGSGDVNTETEYSSAAIMLVMDCSSSLGETDFAKLKEVVNSVIVRLADKSSGIDDVMVDSADDENAPVEYYNLQGQRINNPSNGIYIRRQGRKVSKMFIK